MDLVGLHPDEGDMRCCTNGAGTRAQGALERRNLEGGAAPGLGDDMDVT
jgi:hypothetical protein